MKKWQIYLIAALVVLLIGMIGGYSIRKHTFHCPVITADTIRLVDTVEKVIPVTANHYIVHTDTVIKPIKIPVLLTKDDTLKILEDYYAKHVYKREWKDSLLIANEIDTVTKNIIYPHDFKYKILRPQTIIQNTVDNSITYNRYVDIGLGVPFYDVKYWDIGLLYHWNKGYLGASYYPQMKGFGIQGGVTIIKFKQTKK